MYTREIFLDVKRELFPVSARRTPMKVNSLGRGLGESCNIGMVEVDQYDVPGRTDLAPTAPGEDENSPASAQGGCGNAQTFFQRLPPFQAGKLGRRDAKSQTARSPTYFHGTDFLLRARSAAMKRRKRLAPVFPNVPRECFRIVSKKSEQKLYPETKPKQTSDTIPNNQSG